MELKYSFKQIKGTKEQIHSWTFMFLMKYPTIFLTWLIANFTPLTPNQVTFLSLIPNFIAAYFYFNQNLILGVLFYAIAWLLDAVDGRLARVKGMGSKYGAFFDNYFGQIGFIVMLIGLFYGMAMIKQDALWLMYGIIVFFAVSFHSLIALKTKTLMGDEYSKRVSQSHDLGIISKITTFLNKRGIAEPLNIIDLTVLIFLVGPLAEYFIPGALIVITAFSLIMILIKEIFWFKYYKGMLKKSS